MALGEIPQVRLQPRKGRYFPITGAQALAIIDTWDFGDRSEKSPLSFANPDAGFHKRKPLVQLYPRNDVRVFSLPDEVDRTLGKSAIVRALHLCALLNMKATRKPGAVCRSFIVYLEEPAMLSVVERRTQYRPSQYRATGKLSGVKPRIGKTEEVELETVAI